MEKQIGVTEAREKFREILDNVQHRGDKYVVSRHGQVAVAVVPIEVYETWKQSRERLISLIHEVQSANADADPDEVMQDVLYAQQAIRKASKGDQ